MSALTLYGLGIGSLAITVATFIVFGFHEVPLVLCSFRGHGETRAAQQSAYSPLRTASGGGWLPASDPPSFSGGGHSAKPGSFNGAMSHNLEQARQSFRYAFYRVQGRPISLRRRP